MVELPSGALTFLFTDLENPTRLWEAYPEAMKGALARHDAILRNAVEAHGGLRRRQRLTDDGHRCGRFGILVHLEGRDERARALFEILVATRAPASTAVMYEMIADVEGWPNEDFAARRLERVIEVVQQQSVMGRPDFFASLGVRLREELGTSTTDARS